MTPPTETRAAPPGPSALGAVVAGGIDVILVLVFAALGRGSHDEAATLPGLWQTAWPFLAGLAIVWAVAVVWRRPAAVLRGGLPVWAGTVALGLLLRVLFTDGGAALPFVLVASAVLAIALLGWRAVWSAIRALAKRTHRPD